MKKFYYNKNGKITERHVHVISKPSDKLFCIDLTEFTEEERSQYERELKNIHEEWLDTIRGLGLGTCFRYFKEDNISENNPST